MNIRLAPYRPRQDISRPHRHYVMRVLVRISHGVPVVMLSNFASDLLPGQIVLTRDLSLTDTVLATQVMDERLDCGMDPIPTRLVAPSDITHGSIGPFDPQADLSAQDVCWVIDRLMACEAIWLESASLAGAALMQTLYQCLYVHHLPSIHPDAPLDPGRSDPVLVRQVLRPIIVAVVCGSGLLWNELVKGNLVDGEDFIGDKGGLSLLEDLHPKHAINFLDQGLQWIQEHCGEQHALTPDAASALSQRLCLRKQFLLSIICVAETDPSLPLGYGLDPLASLKQADQHIRDTQALIDRLLVQNTALHSPKMSDAPSDIARASFDPWISRHMETSKTVYPPPILSPFQPLDLPSPEKTIAIFQDTLQGISEYITLIDAKSGWKHWKTFFNKKALSFVTRPSCPYVRSLWQSAVCSENSIVALRQPLTWIADSFFSDELNVAFGSWESVVMNMGNRMSPIPETAFGMQGRIQGFLERFAGQLVSHLRNLAQNRARSRRRMTHSYADLIALTHEASAIEDSLRGRSDNLVPPDFLRCAVQILTLETMLHITCSGFEIDLYRVEELSTAYWTMATVAKELQAVYKSVAARSRSESSFQQQQSTRSMVLFHASQAMFLLFEPSLPPAKHNPWLALSQPDVSDLLDRSIYMKRYSWVNIPSAPESTSRLTALWQSYQNSKSWLQSTEPSARISLALKHLQFTTELLRKPCDQTALTTMLQESLASVASECKHQAVPSATKSALVPLSFDSTHKHPWFPTTTSDR